MSTHAYEDLKRDFDGGSTCGPCQKDGVSVPASCHCDQCQESYCRDCKQQHSRFRLLADHRVKNLDEHVYERLTKDFGKHFDVVVQETPASKKHSVYGEHVLHVEGDGVSLEDSATRNKLYTWSYTHIRRFGLKGDVLTIEVGRSSVTGEGVWKLKSPDGQVIMQVMEEKSSALIKKLKGQT